MTETTSASLALAIDETIQDIAPPTYNEIFGALTKVVTAYLYQYVVDSNQEAVSVEAVEAEALRFQTGVNECIKFVLANVKEKADATSAEESNG